MRSTLRFMSRMRPRWNGSRKDAKAQRDGVAAAGGVVWSAAAVGEAPGHSGTFSSLS